MKRELTLRKSFLVILIGSTLLLAGCVSSTAPYSPTPLYISEIEVAGEYDFGRLEVEVHIVDAGSGRLLGCSGGFQGLQHVDSSNVFYTVDADFERPEGGVLYFEDLRYRDIEVWVIEDDEAACPGPFLPHEDDIIGVSRPIPGRDLHRMINLRFDNVVHLRIGS